MKYTRHMFLAILAILSVSCMMEENMEVIQISDNGYFNIDFGHLDYDRVEIKTKAALDIRQESRVINMWVYIFSSDGQRIFSHFFNQDNRKDTEDETISSDSNCWYAETDDDGNTKGTIRIKAPQTSGATLYLIANIDADMMNISSERLNTIENLTELESVPVHLVQYTTSRNGYFPMTSKVNDVTITQTSVDCETAYLERLDSKITVNLKLADNTELKAFIPELCRIRNLPSASWLTASSEDDYEEAGYFDSEIIFDKQSTNIEGFITGASCSFYMLENRENVDIKNDVTSYHDRDRRIKNPDGSYNESEGIWLNAPDNATYLELKGELHMEINSALIGTQELIGEVIYYIHLGDFATDLNDYNVKRNTHYTYNITIKGVDNIKVEVETDVENESGATGHVYSATESHYTFDAHYGQRVFTFKAEELDIDNMTFYVKTPFGREGTPELPGGGYDISDLDYKWVSFLINEVDADGSYSLNNRIYPGDNNELLIEEGRVERLMNVTEMIQFIREEKEKYLVYKENGFSGENPSLFRKNSDGDYCINITAFVNEFYYESHPTENTSISWRDFVNQPNRLMHILCNTKTSSDGASSVTGSIITIRQRSIQTPYNSESSTLSSAFGCEMVDETRSESLSFYENDSDYQDVDFGNTSTNNGLYNTACLWNMFDSGTFKTGSARERWDTYLDYEIPNRGDSDYNNFLRSDKICMRYAPMSRNRDNNGNGYIDPEELKWYIAPLEQLYSLYLGDLGINSDAQLYPSSLASLPNTQINGLWQWRNHIVCSNQTTITNAGQYISKYWPDMLWAEEGVSISGYGQEWEKQAFKSIRCIRNLGVEDATETTISDISKNIPESMVSVIYRGDGVYRFDLSNMNDNSVRFYTTHELIPNNEYGESSRTYYGFETYNDFTPYSDSYTVLKEVLENGYSPCPTGYRVPNVREAALMSLFCPSSWWEGNTILSSSYYSHGSLGGDLYYDSGTTTWYFQSNYVTISSNANSLRCVRDVF